MEVFNYSSEEESDVPQNDGPVSKYINAENVIMLGYQLFLEIDPILFSPTRNLLVTVMVISRPCQPVKLIALRP